MTDRIRLDHIAIVLVRPRFPENIGAAARAARNMGIHQLVVVDPENYDLDRIKTLATHAAGEVVDQIRRYDDLKAALAGFQYVVGTTARLGGERQVVTSPSRLARELIPISRHNRIAVLFGAEDRGLVNDDLRLCHILANIPTADFSSLNLGQAVMVLCYEMHKASLPAPKPFTPRLASRVELDGMYDQLRDMLVRVNYIQPDNPDYWMNKLRRFFSRIQLRAGEVSIIRGICRQVSWYAGKCFQDGAAGREAPPSLKNGDNG